MNKNPMFLLPAFVILILGGYLGVKWWKSQIALQKPSILTEGVSLDERGQSLLKTYGLSEQQAAQLKAVEGSDAYGVVRWNTEKTSLTVLASLPSIKTGAYQVWLTPDDGKQTKLGSMRIEKGGYVLDYVLKKELLPSKFVVVVSKELKNDAVLEEKLLEAEVQTQE
ncbi:MAG TPA: anti-sigma factor [Patescibacteria group bacterium]|nr:anti-sigma factor [Patescibacteria group bacterium]